MDLGLRGRWALINGGTQDLCEEQAEVFASEGVNLHLRAGDADWLTTLAKRIAWAHDVEIRVHLLDPAVSADPAQLLAAAGNTDILINNAGGTPFFFEKSPTFFEFGLLGRTLDDCLRTNWQRSIDAEIELCRQFYYRFKARGSGVILNVFGMKERPFDFDNIVTDVGFDDLIVFTKALGSHSLDDNIRVVGVNFGSIEPNRGPEQLRIRPVDSLDRETIWQVSHDHLPLGRPPHVREVADMVAFLASDRSAYTSGTIITIDGGLASRKAID